jgi:hypothetical protein
MADAAVAAKPAAARAKARETVVPERAPSREPARPGAMTFTHPVTGEVLTRDPMPTADSQYYIPRELVPDGMVYQWCRESTAGEPDLANLSKLKRNGWREVPHDRHPEYPVRLEGLVLMECPETFVEQSRREERMKAKMELEVGKKPRNESLKPGYFDQDAPSARGANFVRTGRPEAIDPSLRPVYSRQVDIDS